MDFLKLLGQSPTPISYFRWLNFAVFPLNFRVAFLLCAWSRLSSMPDVPAHQGKRNIIESSKDLWNSVDLHGFGCGVGGRVAPESLKIDGIQWICMVLGVGWGGGGPQ